MKPVGGSILDPSLYLMVSVDRSVLAPCNLFPTPVIRTDNISWLYEALADSWINTLGLPNDTRETILRGGFYTTLVRPGLRLISLNTNYYAADNYWLFINATNPLNQVEWVSHSELNQKSNNSKMDSCVPVDSMVKICGRSRREGSYYSTSSPTDLFRCLRLEL